MRDQAGVVIIGAGIVGCSAAYHLAMLGWTDVVVLEQGPLFRTGGSTSHAPGLMFQLNASRAVTRLARASAALYAALAADGEPAFSPVGSVEVATTPARLEEIRRKAGYAASWGLDAALISPRAAADLVPLLPADRLLGALHVPSDGVARAVGAAEALARRAEERGVAFHAHTPVIGVEVVGGRVRAVETPEGRVACDAVLLCAGIWGPRIGRMAGVPVPLSPVQHQYVRTAPLPALAGERREIAHPILRHQDRSLYFRQHGARYGIGSYRHEPLLVSVDDIPRHGHGHGHGERPEMPSVLPFTPEDFAPALDDAAALLPALRGVALDDAINGLFSFTPDGHALLGEAVAVRGFWVAEAIWVTHAGGAGQAIAEWMVEGAPSLDLREMDLNRFHPHAQAAPYVALRAAQQYREVYDIIHPHQSIEQPRNLRLSPFHRRLENLGAVFAESAGWERPRSFDANRPAAGDEERGRTGWAARHWSPASAVEHRAARERVALFDLTPFTKLEVSGAGAFAYLQHMAANDLDRPTGAVIYTPLLDERGGVVCDLTVTRLAAERFLVVTGGVSGPHDGAWLRYHAPVDGSVSIVDVTSALCCAGLWGPRARDVLRRVADADVSNAAFPYFTARPLTIAHTPALAVRVSYAGELGWELYAPMEYGLALWDALWAAGQPDGIAAAGTDALDSLRLEKGYRLAGVDLDTEHDPFAAGLGFAVRLGKGEFMGRAALLRVKERGPTRRLCAMTLAAPDAVVVGKEPVFAPTARGAALGYVTSASYGYTVRRGIAYAYLPVACAAPGTAVEIEYFGRRYGATVATEPLYDPWGTRPKG